MSKALKSINTKVTPQSERAKANQVRNNAGGYVFEVGLFDRVRRFLILGVDGGTYYVGQREFARDNADAVIEAAQADTRRLVDLIVEVSDGALAPKNSPALFALAITLVEGNDKAYARDAVTKVARTATHLFEFAQYIENLGGWGRSKRQAIAGWYESKTPDQLAFQAVKYRQRDGWTHRDLFRLSHPQGVDEKVGRFILGKLGDGETHSHMTICGFQAMQKAGSVKDVLAILEEYPNLPWETIPTQFLTDAKVWKSLFYNGNMGQTALLRNVTRFAKIGAFDDVKFAGDVAKRLSDPEAIAKGRMHPVAYLNALGIYKGGVSKTGYGYGRSNVEWKVNSKVAGALEKGFYAAFKNVEPANKRTMLALDVSGSMTYSAPAGLVGLNCMEAAAAMAMVTLRSEPYVDIKAFSRTFMDLPISDTDSFEQVYTKISGLPFSSTDCALPMVHAKNKGMEIDTFVVYTDNETWAGSVHPFQALKQYRQTSGIDAKLVVVSMTASPFSIADPSDKGMLDVVGFDASAPAVLANFSAGRV